MSHGECRPRQPATARRSTVSPSDRQRHGICSWCACRYASSSSRSPRCTSHARSAVEPKSRRVSASRMRSLLRSRFRAGPCSVRDRYHSDEQCGPSPVAEYALVRQPVRTRLSGSAGGYDCQWHSAGTAGTPFGRANGHAFLITSTWPWGGGARRKNGRWRACACASNASLGSTSRPCKVDLRAI